ncbi:hypothetical protein GQ457_05G008740 [Hibiscus cannabinus]
MQNHGALFEGLQHACKHGFDKFGDANGQCRCLQAPHRLERRRLLLCIAAIQSIVALCNRNWTREANTAADMMSRIVDDSRHHMVISEEVPVDLIRYSWLSFRLPLW